MICPFTNTHCNGPICFESEGSLFPIIACARMHPAEVKIINRDKWMSETKPVCVHPHGWCQYPINCKRNDRCLAEAKNPMSTGAERTLMGKSDESSDETQLQQEIHHFKSGASSSGHKPPYETLTPKLLRRAAQRMEKGMHYGKHNWKKGIQDKQFILDRLNHALEHLMNAMREIDDDQIMTDDDLAAVVVNCMFAMEYQAHYYTERKIKVDGV